MHGHHFLEDACILSINGTFYKNHYLTIHKFKSGI